MHISKSVLSDRSNLVILVSILLIALNLRPAIASVSPVLESIRASLGLGYAAASLLTTIPTLCMGIFAVVTVPITKKLGRSTTITLSVLLLTVSTAARFRGDIIAVLYLSTLGAGIGIAVTQTLLPSLVQQYFADDVGLITGLYTTALISGAALAAGLTAPISRAFEGKWAVGLAIWVIPCILGLLTWVMTSMGTEGNRPTNDDLPTQNLPWKNLWAWFLVIFFAGTQILFFSLLAWLPAMYVNLGWSQQQAGLVLAVFMIAELCGSLGSTAITRSYRDRRLPLGIMLTLSSIGIAGGTFYPLVIPWGWATVMGLGVGGTFALVLTLPVDYTFSPTATDQLTALMFGPGYIIAAAGPFVTGEIRSVTGSFQEAYLLLTGISLTLLFATGLLHPDRQILS